MTTNSEVLNVYSCRILQRTEQDISLMKRQFVITHTSCQTQTPVLLDSWVTNKTYQNATST